MDNAGHDGEPFVIASAIVGVHNKMIIMCDTIKLAENRLFLKKQELLFKNTSVHTSKMLRIVPVLLFLPSICLLAYQARSSLTRNMRESLADVISIHKLLTIRFCSLEISHCFLLCKFVSNFDHTCTTAF